MTKLSYVLWCSMRVSPCLPFCVAFFKKSASTVNLCEEAFMSAIFWLSARMNCTPVTSDSPVSSFSTTCLGPGVKCAASTATPWVPMPLLLALASLNCCSPARAPVIAANPSSPTWLWEKSMVCRCGNACGLLASVCASSTPPSPWSLFRLTSISTSPTPRPSSAIAQRFGHGAPAIWHITPHQSSFDIRLPSSGKGSPP
mmetsp:Transcript_55994/g.131862  ORF Transcript_55994/g.131862 Transcript_55994/m.131862 type:complete len:200 (-) Transcript_55994:68-667(-)